MSDRVDSMISVLEQQWTPTQREFITRNSNRTPIPDIVMLLLNQHAQATWTRIMLSQRAREADMAAHGVDSTEYHDWFFHLDEANK